MELASEAPSRPLERMKTLTAVVGVLVIACAPPLEKQLKTGSLTAAANDAKRQADMLEKAKRECAAARRTLTHEDEAALGQQLLALWQEPRKGETKSPTLQADARVTKVGLSLVPHVPAPGVTWVFLVGDRADVDSFSAPGGSVLVTRGLVDLVSSDAQLAGALAHEMAHVTLGHHLQSLARREEMDCQMRSLGRLLQADAAARGVKDSQADVIAAAAANGDLTPVASKMLFGRDGMAGLTEQDADRAAVPWLHAAGFDASEFAALLPKFTYPSMMVKASSRAEGIEAVKATLPPLPPPKPAPPVKKPKR